MRSANINEKVHIAFINYKNYFYLIQQGIKWHINENILLNN